jgi:hypothetical protein
MAEHHLIFRSSVFSDLYPILARVTIVAILGICRAPAYVFSGVLWRQTMKRMLTMTNRPRTPHARRAAVGLIAMFALVGVAHAAFYINCLECHPVPQNGMAIVNFQTMTNLGAGLCKVFQVVPGRTAVIRFSVTNGYDGNYALNINNFGTGGVSNGDNHMAYTADPSWSSYFPETTTNFFLGGPSTTSPDLWTFNLAVKTNTPADFYTIKSQMAGYDSASQMWSQQETFYVQVLAAPPAPALLVVGRSAGSFSVQVGTLGGFTYYLEYKTDLAATNWNAAAQITGDGTIKIITDATANNSQRFYRVRLR